VAESLIDRPDEGQLRTGASTKFTIIKTVNIRTFQLQLHTCIPTEKGK